MQLRKIIHVLGMVVFISPCLIQAQERPELSSEDITAYTEQSKQLVHFLEGTLNFLGDPDELTAEKDVVINESYAKYFKDDKVQIEDDLDENRETPLNKDVQAYLKDVTFFFKSVAFTYEVNKAEPLTNEMGQLYFKLTINRQIKGITIADDTIDNRQLRYVEVNLDPYHKDLKIASVYTTKPDEKEALRHWWAQMPDTWKDFFGSPVLVFDTLSFNTILSFDDSLMVVRRWKPFIQRDTFLLKQGDTLLLYSNMDPTADLSKLYVSVDTLYRELPDTLRADTRPLYSQLQYFKSLKHIDISNNMMLGNLNPLSEITELESLNFSNTLIDELMPLRNLNKLEDINCSGSPVSSIESLRYMTSLKRLDASKTSLRIIDVMANFKNMESLNLSQTQVRQLDPLTELYKLQQLNLSGTAITNCKAITHLPHLTDLNVSGSALRDLNSIDSLVSLEYLNIDSTQISSLKPLSNLVHLKVLQANYTAVSELSPLLKLAELGFVYCDHSKIDEQSAQQFMGERDDCLVIYNSADLFKWWEQLSTDWKSLLTEQLIVSHPITKEELHQIIKTSQLDLKYKKTVTDLMPLQMLHRLEVLDVSYTKITSLEALSVLTNIRELNFSGTEVIELSPIATLRHLKILKFEKTPASDLMALSATEGLERIYCDKSKVQAEVVHSFQALHPDCLVLYQSDQLSLWWDGLDADWQKALRGQMKLADAPTREQLQQLVDIRKIVIDNDLNIRQADALRPFFWLTSLQLSKTGLTDIGPITQLKYLEELIIPNNPLFVLTNIEALSQLRVLNVENTQISDLEAVGKLSGLKTLNIAGTKVKNLKDISGLTNLEILQINNTNVKSLKQIEDLMFIKELRCYNTSLKASRINDFKASHPHTEVVFY